MADETRDLAQISQQDVDAVTERLKEWIPTLPEQEQLVLGWILTRAAAAENADVSGYTSGVGAGVPVSSLMAQAAGLGGPSTSALPIKTVGPVKVWTFRW